MVTDTVAWCCAGIIIEPLKEVWLGSAVAEVIASTFGLSGFDAVSSGACNCVVSPSSVAVESVDDCCGADDLPHATSISMTNGMIIFFIMIMLFIIVLYIIPIRLATRCSRKRH